MRVKTIRCEKKDEFDVTVNDFLRTATEQGCKIITLLITHLPSEFVASVVFEPLHVETNPDFVITGIENSSIPSTTKDVVVEKDGHTYANIDIYEKY